MKKSLIVILAVAVIGALGVYGKSHSSTAHTGSGNSTTGNATMATDTNSTNGSSGSLKDGTFTGASEDTPYGTVQIAVVVSGGQITNVNFLQMPNDLGHTQEVTAMAEPLLKQETLQAQNAHIDFVSGATSTTEGYIQSLQAALNQATMS